MSGPNKQYDPVEVAALDPAEVERAVADAKQAIAAAGTLDELKAARLAHQGEKSPLALANRDTAQHGRNGHVHASSKNHTHSARHVRYGYAWHGSWRYEDGHGIRRQCR